MLYVTDHCYYDPRLRSGGHIVFVMFIFLFIYLFFSFFFQRFCVNSSSEMARPRSMKFGRYVDPSDLHCFPEALCVMFNGHCGGATGTVGGSDIEKCLQHNNYSTQEGQLFLFFSSHGVLSSQDIIIYFYAAATQQQTKESKSHSV